MANIDVTQLLSDPDFCDVVTLIRRTSAVGDNGRNTVTELPGVNVNMVVQGLKSADFVRNPDLVNLDGVRSFWYQGEFLVDEDSVYSDIIIFGGVRYQVHKLDEDFSNYGAGFQKAFAAKEKSNG